MSYIVKAGTPVPRYPLVKGIADPRGLYPWSVLEARLMTFTDGELPPSTVNTLVNGDEIRVLVFTCDVPVLFKGITGKGAATTSPYVFDIPNSYDSTPLLVNEESGPATDATIATYGQVFRGYTATNRVPCSGFGSDSAEIYVNGRGTSVASNVDIQVFAEGDTISSPIGAAEHGASVFPGLTPIILLESDYTQAIRDNDNLIIDNSVPPTVFGYIVVGLWALNNPVP
jgi:hypothetical protein